MKKCCQRFQFGKKSAVSTKCLANISSSASPTKCLSEAARLLYLQPPVINTSHCALNTERIEFVNSAGQPSGVRVNISSAVVWRKPVSRVKKKHLCRVSRAGVVCAFKQPKLRRQRGEHTTSQSSSRPLGHVFTSIVLECHLRKHISSGWAWVGSGRLQSVVTCVGAGKSVPCPLFFSG